MVTLATEEELLACFRRIDRSHVELAPDLKLPIRVHDLFAWSVGPRAFLLYRDLGDGATRGLAFQRSPGIANAVAVMCEWCHFSRSAGAIKLMSVAADKKRSLGIYVCNDLGCLRRTRDLLAPADVDRTLRRVQDFVARVAAGV
jgi:hypothetical protein